MTPESTPASRPAVPDASSADGDVGQDVDSRAQALLLQNTRAGLRVMAKTCDRPTLHRITDTALAGL